MHYKGQPLAGYDAVIPRIGASVTRYGTAVLRQFELMGSYTPNPSDAILKARDKLRCHQLLAGAGHRPAGDGVRRQPRRHRRPAVDARPAAARDQAQRRHAGRGRDADREAVGLAQRDRGACAACTPTSWCRSSSPKRRARTCAASWSASKVVAAMKRQAPKGDFRSNLHRGGTRQGGHGHARREEEVAVRAAQAARAGRGGRRPDPVPPRPAGAGGQRLARAWRASRPPAASISPGPSSTTSPTAANGRGSHKRPACTRAA